MSFNLATILRESALAAPEAPVAKFMGMSTSYAELDAQSGQFAAGLEAAGLVPGDVVAIQLPNVPQFLVAYFGVLKAGMTLLPLNPLLKAPEISYHLSDAQARILVTFELFVADAGKAATEREVPLYVLAFGDGPLPEGAKPFAALLGEPADTDPAGGIHPTNADDTAVLIYTSGTTGRPKGAMLTHFQLYMNCSISGRLFGGSSDDVTLAVLPFFHVFGLSSIIDVTVLFGGCLSIVPRFEPKAVLDAIVADGVTVIGGVPTMLQALTELDTADRDLSRLRIAVSGGASLPAEIMRAFESKFGIVVLEGYGLSETASTARSTSAPRSGGAFSVGKPIWGVQMRIHDVDDHPVAPGKDNVGEIVIRGHNVMKGYLGRAKRPPRRPSATAGSIPETSDTSTRTGFSSSSTAARTW